MTERPSLTATFSSDQPTGRSRTHGTSEADGTAWAWSHSGSRSVQGRLETSIEVLAAASLLVVEISAATVSTSRTAVAPMSPTRRQLHRWIDTGGAVIQRREPADPDRPNGLTSVATRPS